MSTAPSYTPRAGSLAAQVMAFFQRNPTEELTLEDITDKFDATRGNIHTLLKAAVASDQLTHGQDDDGDHYYAAGPQLPCTRPDAGVIIEHGWAAAGTAKAKAPRKATTPDAPRTPLPDASSIVIEDNVPIPNHRGNLDTDYTPALNKLELKQSFALPVAAKHALIKQICTLHKAKQSRYTMRVNKETQEVRVWRTA